MAHKIPEPSEFELEARRSSDLVEDISDFDYTGSDDEASGLRTSQRVERWMRSSRWISPLSYLARQIRLRSQCEHPRYPQRWARRPSIRRVLWYLLALPQVLILVVVCVTIFKPSYTKEPQHYLELRQRVLRSMVPGRANQHNEKILIVSSVYDYNGELLDGPWGNAVEELVDILGPENVFLSIYENDPNDGARRALERMQHRLRCNSSLVAEHLDLSDLPHQLIPTGEERIRRIAFLAEVRNRALRPLEIVDNSSQTVQFDKLLYLNDVIFDPVDAANLLFHTNYDRTTGSAQYAAACAVDFINPFKFYDTFATRDLEGYGVGLPFYPWFANVGDAASRKDVLDQKDAVRVKSCWGGMVAFDARWFQPVRNDAQPDTDTGNRPSLPNPSVRGIRFRADNELYVESSECCLIHADLQQAVAQSQPEEGRPRAGIFLNPYVRVAYDQRTHLWLKLSRRPERLYAWLHDILTRLVGLPSPNPRRAQQVGEKVIDKVWVIDEMARNRNGSQKGLIGRYELIERAAQVGAFCVDRRMMVLNEHPSQGKGKWALLPIPSWIKRRTRRRGTDFLKPP